MRILQLLVVLALCVAVIGGRSKLSKAAYPDWAHQHWVWLAASQANQTSETDLVQGYLDRDVPVGAVNVDSAWSTGINNFVWDTNKYPNASQMIANFHSMNVRVICWATSLVDTDSPSYQEGFDNDYYLNNGRTIKWWHGRGSFIDYTNPDAMDWWHGQMDNVLAMGLDGWKCDGTDPYVFELIRPEGYAGRITEREYADDYYGDFFNYTRKWNPDSLIMSRPVDSYGPIYWSFSPHYVMFSGWVGDQDPDFSGLQRALQNMFHSAWRNYTNYGSDIGGYRTGDGPLGRTKELFIRWAQMGALVPLMENGGNKEHRPWMFDDNNQTLDIYRTFVYLHYEINPYLLTVGTESYENGVSVMQPMASPTVLKPKTFAYKLGPDLFVTPIIENSTTVSVTFPSGDNWIDWWDHSKVYDGGSSSTFDYELDSFPVFIRQGSMMPLQVNNSMHRHGNAASKDYITLLISQPTVPQREQHTAIRTWWSHTQEVWYSVEVEEDRAVLRLSATAHPRRLLAQIDTTHPRLNGNTLQRAHEMASGAQLKIVSSLEQFDICLSACVFAQSTRVRVKMPDTTNGAEVALVF